MYWGAHKIGFFCADNNIKHLPAVLIVAACHSLLFPMHYLHLATLAESCVRQHSNLRVASHLQNQCELQSP